MHWWRTAAAACSRSANALSIPPRSTFPSEQTPPSHRGMGTPHPRGPLAATSGSRIRIYTPLTTQSVSAFPPTHPARKRNSTNTPDTTHALTILSGLLNTARPEHTGNGHARRSDVIHSETTAAATNVCRVFAMIGRAHRRRRRRVVCVCGWVVAGCHVFYVKPDT